MHLSTNDLPSSAISHPTANFCDSRPEKVMLPYFCVTDEKSNTTTIVYSQLVLRLII